MINQAEGPPLALRVRDVVYTMLIGTVVSSVVGAFLLVGPLIDAMEREATPEEFAADIAAPLIWVIIANAVTQFCWISWIVTTRGSASFSRDLQLRVEPIDLATGLVGGLVILAGSYLMNRFVQPIYADQEAGDAAVTQLEQFVSVKTSLALLLVLTLGLLVPVVEELLFRGMLYGAVELMVGALPAVVISSLIFGVLHAVSWSAAELVTVIWATFAGLMFAIMRLVTGRLGPSLVAHAVNNLVAGGLLWANV